MATPHDAFVHRHIGPDPAGTAEILDFLGYDSPAELAAAALPADIAQTEPTQLPDALDEAGVDRSPGGFGGRIGVEDDERHPLHRVVEQLLLAEPVVAEVVAMIGGEHDQRVLEQVARFHRVEQAPQFVVIDQVTLLEAEEGEPVTLTVTLSTFYREANAA